jgi:hypothetical protein
MRLIGLYREAEYSPGRHRSNDAHIIELVAESLGSRGFRVDLLTLEDAAAARRSAAIVFSMCQGRAALDTLARWELEGTRVVNSPRASLNTYRDRLPAVMRAAHVPFPETRLVSTRGLTADAGAVAGDVPGGVWLKRGDVHASVSADVQWIDSIAALKAGLEEFATRDIAHAALQRHRVGKEIKFYGVAGGAFFHWYFSETNMKPSIGEEVRRKPDTTDPAPAMVDADALQRLAEDAAAAAGLEIFGGDVIVGPSGELTVIDLNDWPSFAPCRGRAAGAIADYLMRRVDAAWSPGLVSSANQGAL